jgi:NAD(P)-dependent dehydrogenase (short-subunit alcohol dehydrogenase family)
MREIKGMSVLVTGGGSGLGEASARLFVQGGAKVTDLDTYLTGETHDPACAD